MNNRIREQLGNYRLLGLLGQGGQASVYLGEHIYLKSQAAVKVRHVALTEEKQAIFLQEAQTLVRLSHPHIVRVLDFALQDGMPFLVMEYAAGGTLRMRHPRGTRLPLDLILTYVKQVASALQYTHDRHLIHRDVKPENMLLNSHEEVLLSDFGLVMLLPQSLSPEDTELMGQSLVGTAPYLAPEQLRGKAQLASDQYALGVVVYEWLCGKPPFHGPFLEVAVQQVSAPPPSLREHVPEISSAIEEVVFRALAKEPEQRFPTVQEFAQALEEACRPESSSQQSLPDLSSHRSYEAWQAPKHNLPAQPTSFIGREQEVAKVCELLSRPEVRLLTLTGPGGSGKTRLGFQVAAELSDRFLDGVYFVNLAPISGPDLVAPTIAQTLAVKESGTRPMLELLQAFLQVKQLLMLLDNFEQVVSAASSVADLLATCPKLKILATSREVLHVRAELEFAVPPLEIPNPNQLPDLATLSHYTAIALFLQRAQAAKPDFQVTNANARTIAEICARLDGLPLAIELAAARMKLLSPQALLARLSQRLQILTSATRDVPARQQTLRNTITWSYQLLDAHEQQLFRRLSVFAGGCTLDAAEAVCVVLDGEEKAESILQGATSLLDKSLLGTIQQEGKPSRLVMLETIREYGLECLAASGEMEAVRQAHASYYLLLAEQAEQEFVSDVQQHRYLAHLKWEHENLRAAMRYMLEQAAAGHSSEMALRLGGALLPFWMMQGYWSQGRNFLRQVLTKREGAVVSAQAKALAAAGKLAFQQGDYDQAEKLSGESLELFRERRDTRGSAIALEILGMVAWNRGHLSSAQALLQEALALYKQTNDKEGTANSLFALAWLLRGQGEYTRARVLCEEGLALVGDLEDTRRIADAQLLMAQMLFDTQAAPTTVRLQVEDVLVLYRQVEDKEGIAACFHLLGQITLLQGETKEARSWFKRSVALHKELGHQAGLAWAVSGLARVALAQDDYVTARNRYEESLARAKVIEDQELLVTCVEGLAMVISAQGEPGWAAQVWGAAEVLRETIGEPLSPVEHAYYEPAIMDARRRLGEQAFAAAWAGGRAMRPDQALQTQMPITALPPSPSTPVAKKMSMSYPAGLTTREVEVLRLVAQGLTNEQVASQLVISSRTVDTHLTSIYGKIGVSSRSAATRYALEQHLV